MRTFPRNLKSTAQTIKRKVLLSHFKAAYADRSGNFAIITALLALPLCLLIGLGIDAARYYNAYTNLQDALDTTSLALAASPEQDIAKLQDQAQQFLLANIEPRTVDNIKVKDLTADEDQVTISVSGNIETTFMKLAQIFTLGVGGSAEAKRAPIRTVEVALVLDNTYSMSMVQNGTSRLSALKKAANGMIEKLLPPGTENVKIGVVPYAQYVNVGMKYTDANWIEKQDDGPQVVVDKAAVKTASGQCETKTTTSNQCPSGKTVTTTEKVYKCDQIDGIDVNCGIRNVSTSSCSVPLEPVNKTTTTCPSDATYKTVNYKWYGCVGSRTSGNYRLNDKEPSIRYPGLMMTSPNQSDPNCLTEILPLTTDSDALYKSIKGLVFEKGSHQPRTYIPAGLIWGQNMLSPTPPLTEAAEYDNKNRNPRKILVLMTDGDNTLAYRNDGRHISASSPTSADNDSKTICTYAKSAAINIEIYTVAFMITNTVAKSLLQSCATDSAHYFDASNEAQLIGAFDGIAKAINMVRLAK